MDAVIVKLEKIEQQKENMLLSEENTVTGSLSIEEYWKLREENKEQKRILLVLLKEKYF